MLWVPDAELDAFTRMLGELISAGLVRNGGELAELTLNVSNVSVEAEQSGSLPEGEFVAVTIRGSGSWDPETTWSSGAPATGALEPAKAAAESAGAVYLYSRVLGDGEGSLTVLVPRRC